MKPVGKVLLPPESSDNAARAGPDQPSKCPDSSNSSPCRIGYRNNHKRNRVIVTPDNQGQVIGLVTKHTEERVWYVYGTGIILETSRYNTFVYLGLGLCAGLADVGSIHCQKAYVKIVDGSGLFM